MTALRALDATGIAGTNDAAGAAPMLQWIEIAQLRVDDGCQRPIGRAGLKTIRAIAADFRWAKFSPVVVAPAVGGFYAIIDGQHRATAALACGFKAVPCQVVLIDRTEQATAFHDINARVTAMHSMALHRALAEAGDEMALRLNAVAERAGVRVLRNPVPSLQQKPGETMAIGSIKRLIRELGDDSTVLVLRFIVEAGGDKPGMLLAPIILGVGRALAEPLRLHATGQPAPLNVALARLRAAHLLREFGRAQREAKEAGTPQAQAFAARLLKLIRKEG